jgi:hypothetical protein
VILRKQMTVDIKQPEYHLVPGIATTDMVQYEERMVCCSASIIICNDEAENNLRLNAARKIWERAIKREYKQIETLEWCDAFMPLPK